MPLSKIEKALYGPYGTHGVFEFILAPGTIQLAIAPWEYEDKVTRVLFRDVQLETLDEYAKPDSLDLPWDIIGFDCYEKSNNRWRFVLHCNVIEWCFVSCWPVIEPGAS